MRLIKIMHGYNFLEVTGEEDYYQIQTSKVKCVIQKADMRVSILIYTNILLEDELFSLGRKLRTWR
jgi:alpha-glucosidase